MRKRLALLFVLISSILCMVGCGGSNPYDKLSIESTTNGQEIQLNIVEEVVDGVSVYQYDTYSFDVKVNDAGKGVSTDISVQGGQGMVDYTTVYKGKGVTTIDVKAVSPDKTGKFTMLIKTVEGNKSMTVDFKIDLKINSFVPNYDSLKVVSKGKQINLNNIDEFINFDPINTTQKDIKFEVVRPAGGVIDGHTGSTYVDKDVLDTYAVIENNILKTFTGVEYPRKIDSANVGNGNDSYNSFQCITLKASYVGSDAYYLDKDGNPTTKRISDRFVDIEVIEDCSNVDLLMNYQINKANLTNMDDSSFVLEKNDNGEYDVTLLNPNYRYGMIYDTYYIERDLKFDFGKAYDGYSPNDYHVVTDPVLETSNKPIVLSYSSTDNSFKVQAQSSGTYSHVFVLDHVRYPNAINREVVVNFHVLDLPTDIKVNGNVVQDSYNVYDFYASAYGARFNIDLNNSVGMFNYFVFAKDKNIYDNMLLYKGDGMAQLAVCEKENGISTIKTKQFSNFKDNETFFIRHSYDNIPNDDVFVYVGVQYSAASSSYSQEIKDNYFISNIVEFPIKLDLEYGIRDLNFTQSMYKMDVTNPNYRDNTENYAGIKLFDLPKGHTFESAIGTNGITYDQKLIKVYDIYDPYEGLYSVYMKSNRDYIVGETKITVTTRNGIVRSANVGTFIPSVYAQEADNSEPLYEMPLGMKFNTNIPLFYFAKNNGDGPQESYELYDLRDIENPVYFGDYLSANKLIMLTNSSMELRFYDYLLAYDDEGNKSIVPIDVTNKLAVEFSVKGYAEYSNGTLKTKDKITADFNNPISIRIHGWSNGYIGLNEKNEKVFKNYYIDHRIELYIYKPLDNIGVTSLNNFTLYVENYLGREDVRKEYSIGKVTTNFEVADASLGAVWNEKWGELVGFDWWQAQTGTVVDPVDLIYDFELMKDRVIYDSNGESVEIRSVKRGQDPYTLTFGDLFEKDEEKSTRYTLVLKCKVSDSLLSWISNTNLSGRYEYEIDSVLAEYVFNKNIVLDINVYAKQFSKLQVIGVVKFTAKVATKSGAIKLDIPDDGVYFEMDHESNSELSQNIGYSVDNANALNKSVQLIYDDNIFTATLKPSLSGRNGVIEIVAKKGAVGDDYLTIVPQDNIKSVDNNENYIFFDNSLVQKFRVHISDGSKAYPYEIKSVNDYNKMQQKIKDGNYYHYVLTTNINLSDVDKVDLVFNENNVNTFSLSGTYTYYRNGVESKVISRLYNLNIKETINATDDVYIGLFDKLTSNVALKDITLINASIDIRIESLNGKDLYIGLLGAFADKTKIENSQVIGSIKITNATKNEDIGPSVNIGGMFGCAKNITLQGSPITYQAGVSNTAYNANVGINYLSIGSTDCEAAINNYSFNVGGLIGSDELSTLNNINVISTIKGINYNSAVGGIIGYSKYSQIENAVVYPKIDVHDYISENGVIEDPDNIVNVGGFVGCGHPSSQNGEKLIIRNSKTYFTKEYTGNIWSNKVAMYVNTSSKANVGGLVGSANNILSSYNYVRSFYSEDISNIYKGDIYVNANDGSNIGGLIGYCNSQINMNNSYFDGDIVACNNHHIGLLIGSIDSGKIIDSYAIGSIATDNGTSISIVNEINNNSGIFGNMDSLSDTAPSKTDTIFGGLIDDVTYNTKAYNFEIENVYSVVNQNVYYFGESNSIHALYQSNKTLNDIIPDIAGYGNIGLYFKEKLGYSLLVDDVNLSSPANTTWLWNDGVNFAGGIPFPILFNSSKTQAMFDVVPNSIIVDRINESYNGFYNISADGTAQILMFVNKNSSDIKSTYYEIRIDDETSAISISFDGGTIFTSFIEINSEIEIIEDSAGSIISLVGSKIYPKGEGIATLTLRSALDKTVKLDIIFKVIAGISDVEMLYSNENNDAYNKFEEIGEREDNPSTGTYEDIYFTNVYIDEVSNYKIINNNVINGVQYDSSNSYGYIVEILKNKDDGSESYGKININGKDYIYRDGENNTYLITTSELSVKGVEIGFVRMKFTPCILLNDVKVQQDKDPYKILSDLTSDTYRFMVGARARSVDVDKDNVKIASKNSTNISVVFETSNIIIQPSVQNDVFDVNILSNFTISIGILEYFINCEGMYTATVDNNGVYTLSKNDGTICYEIEYQLIKFRISMPTIQLTDVDTESSRYTYKVVFGITVEFNADYYRQNADSIDLNTVTYEFTFTPNSNQSIKDRIVISISPAELTELFTNFYTKGELLFNPEQENYPAENESSFIVPGRSGLLKITMDEEFNDSSYLEILIDNKYKPYLSVQQMAGYVENVSETGELLDSITAYNELAYDEDFERAKEYGIKLSKLTLNYNDKNYFNKTYFVKIDLKRNYGMLEKIELKIVSYKVTTDSIEIKPTKDFSLKVTQLPVVEVKLDNEYDSNLGKGVKKALDISYKAVTNDINFTMTQADCYEGTPVSPDTIGENSELFGVYIVDEDGSEVNSLFSIDYLNSGKKYYICADVEADLQKIVMNFSVSEIILGVTEYAKSDLTINIVEFEIDNIVIDRSINGVVTLKHGQSFVLATNIEYVKPTIQTLQPGVAEDSTPINQYKLKLDDKWNGIVTLVEYSMAGTTGMDAVKEVITGDQVTYRYKFYDATSSEYRDVENGKSYNHISIGKSDSDIISKEINGVKYSYKPYVIRANSVTGQDSAEELQLVIPYYYEKGKMIVGKGNVYNEKIIEFKIIVEDNSTYDHPNPIEDADQLINACKSNGGDYILLNNITLKNWAPIAANFNSLDGNGYSIIIESFGLSQIRGSESEVNVGVFSEVSEHTLLKNIIVDVSGLLKTESTMIRDVESLRQSNKSSYEYKDSLDLAFTNKVNFGVLAGVNNGSITNARVVSLGEEEYVNEHLYLHLNTNQGYMEETLVETKIGGLVGINSTTGAITNSFVGLNVSGKSGDSYTIKTVTNPSDTRQNNKDDKLEDNVEIYPFILTGGNILGGLVAENQGIISNSYTKALGLYNTYPAVEDSKTAGFVATNKGTITSAYVEGLRIVNYRSVEDKFLIESTGNIGGFVFDNNAVIENAYSNAFLETQSAFTGGFVFRNNAGAEIRNSYASTINKNNLAHGQFTGVGSNGRDLLNYGTYTYCYYLVLDNEVENLDEDAIAIKSATTDISKASAWKGFSIVEGQNTDAIWKVSPVTGTPTILATLTDTYSFRRLTSVEEKQVENDPSEDDSDDGLTLGKQTIYTYAYVGAQLGTEVNPLIIDSSEHFYQYILDLGIPMTLGNNTQYVFGYHTDSNAIADYNNIGYVRLVNNLDFTTLTDDVTKHKGSGKYLYETIFAGVLDGNGMELKNLNINCAGDLELESFGLFSQIGLSYKDQLLPAIVKNLNMSVRTYGSGGSSRAGILAGTIINSKIINVKINGGMNGENIVVSGQNMTGGLAGLIYTDGEGRNYLQDIVVENIALEATMTTLAHPLTEDSNDMSTGFYKVFSVINQSSQEKVETSFRMLGNYDDDLYYKDGEGKPTNNIRKDVSYAGTVAGVIFANNHAKSIQSLQEVTDYRSATDGSTINNVVVRNNVNIRTADHAGGLFGYVGYKTVIKNSKFVLNGNQLIKAFNYAGGLVGENHGIIEQCTIAFDDKTQAGLDKKIVQNNRESGDYLLFANKKSDGSGPSLEDYTVAIGGIAGYSYNGVIIDCYAKVNVVKPRAYIAGGILGYSEDVNYIAYSYTTGAVYGQMVTGGIVGVTVNPSLWPEYQVSMINVISLTDWNYTTSQFNYRQKLTESLYENQKDIYKNYNFYVKMPEVGNLMPKLGGRITYVEAKDQDDLLKQKYVRERALANYFVGSVIGSALINDGYDTTDTVKVTANSNKYHSPWLGAEAEKNHNIIPLLTDDLRFDLSKNVISNTLGIYSESGSLANGNKIDSYNNKFDYLPRNSDKNIGLYSYRIAYATTNATDLNFYEFKDIPADGSSNTYYDVIYYEQVFTAQEYTQQILGRYSNVVTEKDPSSQETKTYYKTTTNLFENNFERSNRYNKTGTDNAFVNPSSQEIWKIDTLLPEYNTEGYESTKYIHDDDDLEAAFTYGGNGITYKILPGSITKDNNGDVTTTYDDPYQLTITTENSEDNKLIKFTNTLRDTYIGVPNSSGVKPKIIINIQNTNGVSSVISVLNQISGATLSNIDFEINYNGYNSGSDKTHSDYGLFANTLQNSYIDNCNFTLNLIPATGNDATVNLSDDNFKSVNTGLFFGAIRNSTVTNSTFDINVKNIIINDEDIANFGGFAGLITQSKIEGNSFKNSHITTQLENYKDVYNQGMVAGTLSSSSFYNNEITSKETVYYEIIEVEEILNGVDKLNKTTNIGYLFGRTTSSNVVTLRGIYNDTITKSPIVDSALSYTIVEGMWDIDENPKPVQNANIAVVAGSSYDSTFDDFVNRIGLDITDETAARINSMNVGTIVGYDNGGTKIGARCAELKINDSGNRYSYIGNEGIICIDKVDVYNLSVGGLVGYSSGSSELLANAYNNPIAVDLFDEYRLFVSNNLVDNMSNQVNTYVGGLVGQTSKGVGMHDVFSAGLISVNAEYTPNNYTHYSIGGIVGCNTSGNITLEDFTSIPDFDIKGDVDQGISYVAGVVGHMKKGSFLGKYGYSYVELPKDTGNIGVYGDYSKGRGNISGILTASIVNGSQSNISTECENVFYAQEFIGNNYEAEVYFRGFAMADLYPFRHYIKTTTQSQVYSCNPNADIYKVLYENGFNTNAGNGYDEWKKNRYRNVDDVRTITIFIPTGIWGGYNYIHYTSVGDAGTTRFNPKMLTTEDDDKDNSEDAREQAKYFSQLGMGYYVLANYSYKTNSATSIYYYNDSYHYLYIGTNYGIISGQTLENGKIHINSYYSVSGSTPYQHIIGENHGVISNVYMGRTDQPYNYLMVNENGKNGLITNCYVYGLKSGDSNVGIIAKFNDGRLYQSASAVIVSIDKSFKDQDYDIYGLVGGNRTTGVISDCYSKSFGDASSHKSTANLYLIKGGTGIIKYSMVGFPSLVGFENVVKGITKDGDKIDTCQTNLNPYWGIGGNNNRRGVWTTEIDQSTGERMAQIHGIHDAPGATVIDVRLIEKKVDSRVISWSNNRFYYYISDINYSFSAATSTYNINSIKSFKDKIMNDYRISTDTQTFTKYNTNSYSYDKDDEYALNDGEVVNFGFNFQLKFYQSTKPNYNAVVIGAGNQLKTYINGLKDTNNDGYKEIPNNTIVIVCADKIEINQNIGISIPENSAFVGVNPYDVTGDGSYSVGLGKVKIKYTGNTPIKDYMFTRVDDTAFGLLMGFDFQLFNLQLSNQYYAAPIYTAYGGVLNNLQFSGCTIEGQGITRIAGIVGYAGNNSFVTNCHIGAYTANGKTTNFTFKNTGSSNAHYGYTCYIADPGAYFRNVGNAYYSINEINIRNNNNAVNNYSEPQGKIYS